MNTPGERCVSATNSLHKTHHEVLKCRSWDELFILFMHLAGEIWDWVPVFERDFKYGSSLGLGLKAGSGFLREWELNVN